MAFSFSVTAIRSRVRCWLFLASGSVTGTKAITPGQLSDSIVWSDIRESGGNGQCEVPVRGSRNKNQVEGHGEIY